MLRKKSLALCFSLLIGVATCVAVSPSSPNVAGQVPQLGNGFAASFVNSTHEFMSGVFGGNTTNSTRAGYPNPMRIFFHCDEGLHVTSGPGPGYPFSLDMDSAIATYEGTCTKPPVQFKQELYYLRALKHASVIDTTVTSLESAGGNISFSFDSFIEPHNEQLFPHMKSKGTVRHGSMLISSYETIVGEFDPSNINGVTFAAVVPNTAFQLAPRETARLPFVQVRLFGNHSIVDTATVQKAFDEVLALFEIAGGGDTQRARQQAEWAALWNHSMKVEGNMELDRVIAASQYALWSSMRDDEPWSTSPGGLPTDGYNGHTFWDMETWMLPNLILFQPAMALGSALEYRFQRQWGAADNAVNVVGGRAGIAFPWESAQTGWPVCPWPQGLHTEIHITADVVVAWRMFYHATHDDDWLRRYFEPMNATSNFWLSRAVRRGTQWHIDGVTPPDEFHFGDDSAYTNAAVKTAVNFTIWAGMHLNLPTDPQLVGLVAHLVVPFNATGQYHLELGSGYNGTGGYDGTGGYNGTGDVKQADVILMHFPMAYPMAASTALNDLNYYAPRTTASGPAMTWSVFSAGYLAVGQLKEAAHYFTKGYKINSLPPYYQWYEVPGGGGCPNFLTGAGGFLQSIWGGLGGVRIRDDAMVIQKTANLRIANVTSLSLHGLMYLGVPFNIDYSVHPPFGGIDLGGATAGSVVIRMMNTTEAGRWTVDGKPLTEKPVVIPMGDHDIVVRKTST